MSITIHAVPSGERRSMMTQIEHILPAVCGWIAHAQVAAPTWRMTGHELMLEIRDGRASVVAGNDRVRHRANNRIDLAVRAQDRQVLRRRTCGASPTASGYWSLIKADPGDAGALGVPAVR